jgi:DNA-binding response OmpR family regulator
MPCDTSTFLLVEDDPNDVFFLQYAFEQAGIKNRLVAVEHGQEAIDYLSGRGKYGDRSQYPLPCIVLLDLKLPGVSGLDVLRWARKQPEVSCVLFIVLTSSKDQNDIHEAYRLGARSYLVKPLSLEERLEVAKAIKAYWLQLNVLPRPKSGLPKLI